MTTAEYDQIRVKTQKERDAIVMAKRPEYTEGNPDVLFNFKTVASEVDARPEQVWYTYFRKHVASIARYCADPSKPSSEPILGRIYDAMNYLDLLAAQIQERKE